MSEADRLKLTIPINERDHTIGPADAAVTVVHYGDYQCPDCHRRHHEIQKLIDELLHSVRFVYRHFPLVNVHPQALRAAEAAEAAAAQGKFWEMHRHLYSDPDKLGDRNLRHYAHAIGLDLGRYDSEMASSRYADQILQDYHNSVIYGITGTPTTFVNGVLYPASSVELLVAVKSMLGNQTTQSP